MAPKLIFIESTKNPADDGMFLRTIVNLGDGPIPANTGFWFHSGGGPQTLTPITAPTFILTRYITEGLGRMVLDISDGVWPVAVDIYKTATWFERPLVIDPETFTSSIDNPFTVHRFDYAFGGSTLAGAFFAVAADTTWYTIFGFFTSVIDI